jgi:hypothetical protein
MANRALAEEHAVHVNVAGTTLSGYIDTSAIWHWSLLPGSAVPSNDNFANAGVLLGLKNVVKGSNVGATFESGEPSYTNAPGTASVWYSWTAPYTGRAQVSIDAPTFSTRVPAVSVGASDLSSESIFAPDGGFNAAPYSAVSNVVNHTYGLSMVVTDAGYWGMDSAVFIGADSFVDVPSPPFQPILAVYTGESLETLDLIGRSSVAISFQAIAGQKYSISFVGLNDETGTRDFWVAQTPPPANDDFANALLVQGASAATLEGNVSSASREAGEPNLGPLYSGGSVWFHWKARTYGPAGLTNTGTIFPMAVYRGDTFTNLALIDKSTNGAAAFFAEDGQDYWIALYRGAQTEDEFSLQLTGPIYRSFSVSMAELMPPGYFPYFYGLRGQTILLYANTATGRQCVEIEPIKDGKAVLLRRPESVDGQLQIVTIDSILPAPHVQFVRSGALLVPTLRGFPGQSCEISYSSDLVTWHPSRSLTLTARGARMASHAVDGQPALFYRVMQRFPPLEMAPAAPR